MVLLPSVPSSTARRVLVVLLMVAGLGLVATGRPAVTDEDIHDNQPAPEDGEAAPLQDLLARIRQDFAAKVLEVELEDERVPGRRMGVYEAKVVTPEGNVLVLRYDAKTLEFLEAKGHYRHHRGNVNTRERQ